MFLASDHGPACEGFTVVHQAGKNNHHRGLNNTKSHSVDNVQVTGILLMMWRKLMSGQIYYACRSGALTVSEVSCCWCRFYFRSVYAQRQTVSAECRSPRLNVARH